MLLTIKMLFFHLKLYTAQYSVIILSDNYRLLLSSGRHRINLSTQPTADTHGGITAESDKKIFFGLNTEYKIQLFDGTKKSFVNIQFRQ